METISFSRDHSQGETKGSGTVIAANRDQSPSDTAGQTDLKRTGGNMGQVISAFGDEGIREWIFPAATQEVLPGVCWGWADSAFSPAYWALQLQLVKDQYTRHCFQTGETLFEETVFCLLGGHGISYELNRAAFDQLRCSGLLRRQEVTVTELAACLAEPISMEGRSVKYRYPNRRAEFIANAHAAFANGQPPQEARELRSWLLQLSGIGPKTASWIVRNWLDSDDVAIVDIHIQRAGLLAGIFHHAEKVERHYFLMEQKFLRFAAALGVRASMLDGLMWAQMRAMPTVVEMALTHLQHRAASTAQEAAILAVA